jgi:Resolvase, N terminal domain
MRRAIVYLPSRQPGVDQSATDAAAVSGVEIVAVVREAAGPGRSGLAEVLARIGASEASAVVVERLRDLSGSLHELVALLEWLEASGAHLIAEDVGLDTGTRAVAAVKCAGRARLPTSASTCTRHPAASSSATSA